MLAVGLDDPVQIAPPVLDEMRQVDSDEDVNRQSTPGAFREGKVELLGDGAATPVCSKEVFGANGVGLVKDAVTDFDQQRRTLAGSRHVCIRGGLRIEVITVITRIF